MPLWHERRVLGSSRREYGCTLPATTFAYCHSTQVPVNRLHDNPDGT